LPNPAKEELKIQRHFLPVCFSALKLLRHPN
jgi:hypothetical protein